MSQQNLPLHWDSLLPTTHAAASTTRITQPLPGIRAGKKYVRRVKKATAVDGNSSDGDILGLQVTGGNQRASVATGIEVKDEKSRVCQPLPPITKLVTPSTDADGTAAKEKAQDSFKKVIIANDSKSFANGRAFQNIVFVLGKSPRDLLLMCLSAHFKFLLIRSIDE